MFYGVSGLKLYFKGLPNIAGIIGGKLYIYNVESCKEVDLEYDEDLNQFEYIVQEDDFPEGDRSFTMQVVIECENGDKFPSKEFTQYVRYPLKDRV